MKEATIYIQISRDHCTRTPLFSFCGFRKTFLCFSDNLSNTQRQKLAKRITKNIMRTYLQIKWIDGSIIFNNCQIEHKDEVKDCIEKIPAIPPMSVYAQTEPSWEIRRLLEEIIGNRRKSYLRQKKRTAFAEPEQIRETQETSSFLLYKGSENRKRGISK